MKTVLYSTFITFTIGLFIFGCKENTEQLIISGQLIKHTSCKDNFKSASEITPDSLSCIDYYFDQNKLSLKHINAGFNCCPERLWCNISLKNDTIIVQEFEKSALCDCNCLYDLDMEVTGVTAKKYILKFVDPYCGEQEKLIFEIDLIKETEGLFCVTRKQYPWGIYSINQ
jgi:hypothetical protein